jgi:CubicO group peptidase (beta-lactamase class C family)
MFWVIDPTPDGTSTVIWHNGATGGYASYLLLVPAKHRAVAVLANTARPQEVARIANAIVSRLWSSESD